MGANLDNEELLRLALDAIGKGDHANAMSMLKTLIERDPNNLHGNYLLAAEHAQIGMMDRAETGFRRAVELGPDFPMARFQLGQLLLLKGDNPGASEVFAPLAQSSDETALTAYARGMKAAADNDGAEAVRQFQIGLGRNQDIPVLATDMQRALDNLLAAGLGEAAPQTGTPAGAAPLYLSNYGKSGD